MRCKKRTIVLVACLTVVLMTLSVQTVFAQPSPFTVVSGTQKVFFASNRITVGSPEGDYEIYRMNSDGTSVEQLTSNSAMDWHPVASSDGTKMVFASDRDGDQDIYIMNTDGSSVVKVTNNSVFDGHPYPKPSVSGIDEIVFNRRYSGETDNEIVKITYPGLVETRLTTNDVKDGHPTWSTTGLIAFGSDQDGDWDIYTMTAVGASRTKRTTNTYLDAAPSWNSDGSKIIFHSKQGGSMGVYTMNANGTGRALIPNTSGPNFDGTPFFSGDATNTTETVYVHEGSGADWDSEIVKINMDGTGKTALTNNTNIDDLFIPYLALLGQDPGASCDLKSENPLNPHYIKVSSTGADSMIPTVAGLLVMMAGGLLLFKQRRHQSQKIV